MKINGLAVAGLVVGIVAVLLCWMPGLGVGASVTGIVISSLGIAAVKRSGNGRGLAIAGVICSSLALVLSIAAIVVISEIASAWAPN